MRRATHDDDAMRLPSWLRDVVADDDASNDDDVHVDDVADAHASGGRWRVERRGWVRG